MTAEAISLSQLNKRIVDAIASTPALQNVWVTAETMDVRCTGGHCYMELIEKDPANGRVLAKSRATIWASTYYRLAAEFASATGQQFGSNMKVMVRVSVNAHAVYGISLNITAINPAYTLGDMMQRRLQILEQLRKEGIIDMNRSLQWPDVPQRIAVISAAGAAGYGDFIHQLYHNAWRLRFTTRLFPALMQGESTPSSTIAKLDEIAAEIDHWDCVVIIRGGGATSDLASFDNYDLAANIAQFPIPVIVGIGHERDTTVLDYVANMRVKTPTAAAEWLIGRGEQALGQLQAMASAMLQSVTDCMSGCHRQLSYIEGQLPAAATSALMRASQRMVNARVVLSTVADRRLLPELTRLQARGVSLQQAVEVALAAAKKRLDADAALLSALSPEATLRRGYTITLADGHPLTSADLARQGQQIETVFADGTIKSTISTINTTTK